MVSYERDLVAKFGSGAKVRLLGGMWLDKTNLPREVTVSLSESSSRIRVEVKVRDSMGFGSRAGLADKIKQVMYEDAISIKGKFPDATSIPKGNYPAQ